MTPAPENPPAFPQPIAGCTDGCVYETKSVGGLASAGMTLRDWFAGRELQAHNSHWFFGLLPHPPSWRARWAYDQADAMLAARTQPKPAP